MTNTLNYLWYWNRKLGTKYVNEFYNIKTSHNMFIGSKVNCACLFAFEKFKVQFFQYRYKANQEPKDNNYSPRLQHYYRFQKETFPETFLNNWKKTQDKCFFESIAIYGSRFALASHQDRFREEERSEGSFSFSWQTRATTFQRRGYESFPNIGLTYRLENSTASKQPIRIRVTRNVPGDVRLLNASAYSDGNGHRKQKGGTQAATLDKPGRGPFEQRKDCFSSFEYETEVPCVKCSP